MAKKDRTGNRITREQRAVRRIPEMGYYLVVTDTEATERCYFTGLHKSLPSGIRHKLVIKVVETYLIASTTIYNQIIQKLNNKRHWPDVGRCRFYVPEALFRQLHS